MWGRYNRMDYHYFSLITLLLGKSALCTCKQKCVNLYSVPTFRWGTMLSTFVRVLEHARSEMC